MLLEIFRAGKHRDSNGTDREFTESDLAQIAQTYDPLIYRAPILKNHDETQPNVGLISGMAKVGDRLFALPYKVDDTFAQQVNQGRYPAVSVALYHPQDPSNPKPGNWGLRHLGFPQIPAVKGMKAPSFAENPDHDVFINFEEVMPYEPAPVEEKPEIKEDKSEMTLEQREARLNEREKLLQDKEAQLESDRVALQDAQFNEFIKANSTKIHPKEKPYLLASMKSIAGITQTITFGEASLTPLQAFQKSITERPDLVKFGELAPSSGGTKRSSGSTNVEFSAPKGYRVESNALDRHGKALAYCEAHKLDPHNQADYFKALGAIA